MNRNSTNIAAPQHRCKKNHPTFNFEFLPQYAGETSFRQHSFGSDILCSKPSICGPTSFMDTPSNEKEICPKSYLPGSIPIICALMNQLNYASSQINVWAYLNDVSLGFIIEVWCGESPLEPCSWPGLSSKQTPESGRQGPLPRQGHLDTLS